MESLNVLLVFTQLSPACLRGQPIVQNQTCCSGAKWLVEEIGTAETTGGDHRSQERDRNAIESGKQLHTNLKGLGRGF